nr:CARDB domain-containing protein [Chromatium okenii]
MTATFTTIPAATADFIITGIILTPANPQTNGLFAANITVKNQGTSAADGGTLSVWTNRATKPVCSTGGDKAVPIGSVAAGNTKVLTIGELAAGAVGTKKLYAFADSKCVRQEIDETNNQLTKNYTVKQ